MALIMLAISDVSGMLQEHTFADGAYVPSWQVGQSWEMKVYYSFWGGKGQVKPLSQPLMLKYVIKEKTDGGDYWMVRVTGEGGGRSVSADLLYRVADFSIEEAVIESVFIGKTVRETFYFGQGKPAVSSAGIPLDQPVSLKAETRKTLYWRGDWRRSTKGEILAQIVRDVSPDPTGKVFEVICEDEEAG